MGVADRVERLCRRFGDGDLDEIPDNAAAHLSRILDLIRGGTTGDALIPSLDMLEAAMTATHDGLTIPTRGFRRVPGIDAHPVVHAWVCPENACSRRVLDYDTAGEPDPCPITGQPLKQVRLPT
jgi:hypothetical protein